MKSLPKLTIVVADAAPKWRTEIAEIVRAAIDDATKGSSFLATLATPALIECGTYLELESVLLKPKRSTTIEPCLLVTDRIGTNSLPKTRLRWPQLPVVFHSGGAGPDDVFDLFRNSRIDLFVKKGDTQQLHDGIVRLFNKYWTSSTKRSMRYYICNISRDPSRKCYEDRIGERQRWINMFEIYMEVICGTTLGRHLEELWDEMLTLTTTTPLEMDVGH